MYNIVEKILVLVAFLLLLGLIATFIAFRLIAKIQKNNQVIVNGTLINNLKTLKENGYWRNDKPISSARWFIMDATLQEFEPGLRNLENIPSGRVSKLFLQGRGSWRLTQGNILTQAGLDESISKEFSMML